MAEEILLKAVHHVHSLFKQERSLAAVHEYCFCTKHLRHLGKYRRTTLSHEPVAEFSYERVGGYTAETVTSTAFQSYAQFADRLFGAFIVAGFSVEVA